MGAFENQCSEMSRAELTQMLGDAFDRSRALEDQITELQARNSELVTERRAWRKAAEEACRVHWDGGSPYAALHLYREALEELKRG